VRTESPSLASQGRTIARRSIARTLRQPAVIVPNMIFPLFMLAVLSKAGAQATKIPGFPTKSYTTFVLGATLVQGATSAATVAGGLLAEDIEGGFMNRMLLTPVRKSALITAQLAGVMIVGLIQAIIFLVVGLIFGVSVKAGVGGAIVLILVAWLLVLAFGSIGLFVAAAVGATAQVQALTGLFIGLMFMSSMLMPRNLIKHSWFKDIATYNPISYLVEATRSLLIKGWDGEALALGCGIAVVALVLALIGASRVLQRTLERT
jgi:ABC-2 type transport system permease protein